MSAPEVTIVIIAHSVQPELDRCLGSIRDHADALVLIVLVDNASTDGTPKWVRQEHPEVELIRLERNLGYSARNLGLERASGRYTMFLDSDARLTEGALPTLVNALDDHQSWGLVAPRLVNPDGTLQLSCRRFPPPSLPLRRRPPLARFLENSRAVHWHLMADVDHTIARPVLYAISACHLFRTELGKRLGGLDQAFGRGGCEDIDWCIRIWDAGSEVVYLPEAVVVHEYRRQTSKSPLSRAALSHLLAFGALQWRYRKRRRKLMNWREEMDPLWTRQ
ncbi:MAG: glycosyltransferase family 2 protein [Solirubrobacterales bacterium]